MCGRLIGLKTERQWIQTARLTHEVHVTNLKKDSKWRVQDTAAILNRAVGSVSEDLLVYAWLTDIEVRKCFYLRDAVKYIRQAKKQKLIDLDH